MSKKKSTEAKIGNFTDRFFGVDSVTLKRMKVKGEIVIQTRGRSGEDEYELTKTLPSVETFSIPAFVYRDEECRKFVFEFMYNPQRNLRLTVFEIMVSKSFWTADESLIEFFDEILERQESWSKSVAYKVPDFRKKVATCIIPPWLAVDFNPSMGQFNLGLTLARNVEVLNLNITPFAPVIEQAVLNNLDWLVNIIFDEFKKMDASFKKTEREHFEEFKEVIDL